MDNATILGLAGGFGFVALAILIGGSPAAFVSWPALLIVLGGTAAVTTISFSLSEILNTQNLVMHTMFRTKSDVETAAREVISVAEQARRHGEKDMERLMQSMDRMPFLARGIEMILDGAPPEDIERTLAREVDAMTRRHIRSASVLRRAAEVAPAMGLIGTLVGLVQLLGNLQEPETIGPAMAVALLTTFYGAILANMVFAPLANKLERNSADEAMLLNIYALGAASIRRKENPRRLEMLINATLPPAQRVHYFD